MHWIFSFLHHSQKWKKEREARRLQSESCAQTQPVHIAGGWNSTKTYSSRVQIASVVKHEKKQTWMIDFFPWVSKRGWRYESRNRFWPNSALRTVCKCLKTTSAYNLLVLSAISQNTRHGITRSSNVGSGAWGNLLRSGQLRLTAPTASSDCALAGPKTNGGTSGNPKTSRLHQLGPTTNHGHMQTSETTGTKWHPRSCSRLTITPWNNGQQQS